MVLLFTGLLIFGLVLLCTESVEDVRKDFGIKEVK